MSEITFIQENLKTAGLPAVLHCRESLLLTLQIFCRRIQRIFFEYSRKIAARCKPQQHGNVSYGHSFKKEEFGIFNFLLVNEMPGGDAKLFFEFLLILRAGKVGESCQLFQRKFLRNIIKNIV